jgi:uncharacterized membrane protein
MSLTTLFAVILVPVLLGGLGLVADGGMVLVARREVQGVANSAAHAGAAELDVAANRAQPGLARLDPRAAEDAAERYVRLQERGFGGRVEASAEAVYVQVTSPPIPMTFLRLAGIMQVQVAAEATAVPRTGIQAAGR